MWLRHNFFVNKFTNETLSMVLTEFLNENKINDFKIVTSSDTYLEIVYKVKGIKYD